VGVPNSSRYEEKSIYLKPRLAIVVGVGLVLLGLAGVWQFQRGRVALREAAAPSVPMRPAPIRTAAGETSTGSAAGATEAAPAEASPRTEEERHKEIDREHLRKLHAGLFAYKARHGHFPEYLSQMVPEFVTADVLTSPRHPSQGMNAFARMDHPDPGVETPAYGYEFSNLEFRDGRTFAEIKEVQRAEWGDAVPILRAFGYHAVINMAYGGELYETALNWEWDAATLDVVDKLGWGPGLTEGEMVRVRVAGPDGAPLANAHVWADGRNYSFDLPNRPFPTDAEGYATIPVGADLDRTALRLRADAPGLASPVASFALGQVPTEYALTLAPAEPVGGVALGADGQPLPYARVVLKQASTGDDALVQSGAELATVRADAQGRWQASLPPDSVEHLTGVVGEPRGTPLRFAPTQPLSAADARAGTAAVSVPGTP
jgi:hypothetical protein